MRDREEEAVKFRDQRIRLLELEVWKTGSKEGVDGWARGQVDALGRE